MDDVAGGIRQDLHLDVARCQDEAFEEQRVIPEGGSCDTPRGNERSGQLLRSMHGMHSLAAAPCGRFDQQRKSDLRGLADELLVGLSGLGDARHHGDAVAGDVVLRSDLVAHHVQGVHRRADEDDSCGGEALSEGRVLAEEAVAGMHRRRAGPVAGAENGLAVEIAFRGGRRPDADSDVRLDDMACPGVGVAVDRDRPDAEAPQGADDPAGDLATVRHQDRVEEGGRRHQLCKGRAGNRRTGHRRAWLRRTGHG